MIRTIIGFAAGFVIGGIVVNSGSAKKFKTVAAAKASQLKSATRENAAKLKSATRKAAAAVREEFSSQGEDAGENA
jgi:hypothetical protein